MGCVQIITFPFFKGKLSSKKLHEILTVFSLLIGSYILQHFDPAVVYHFIKAQETIKLYVAFNILELFDKLFSSFGLDIFESLRWNIAAYLHPVALSKQVLTASSTNLVLDLEGISPMKEMLTNPTEVASNPLIQRSTSKTNQKRSKQFPQKSNSNPSLPIDQIETFPILLAILRDFLICCAYIGHLFSSFPAFLSPNLSHPTIL